MCAGWSRFCRAGRAPEKNADAIHGRAIAIFGAIQGAQLVSRSRNDVAVYDEIVTAYRASGLLP